METENARMQPPPVEGERRNDVNLVNREGEEAYRYCLKAPTFTGSEDVEQFRQEFREVMEIAQWPHRVALIQLRRALTEQAKPYGVGTDVNGILAALRARFGISAVDARTKLQRLCRAPRTSLQEHAATVKKLAQIAYGDLPAQHQERYTYDAFVQSLNDLGLHHQLRAKGITRIEDALKAGEAYLLATQMHRAQRNPPVVGVSAARATTSPEAPPLEAEVDRMVEMLGQLVTILAGAGPGQALRLPPTPVGPGWSSAGQDHGQQGRPQYQGALNCHGPRTHSLPAGRN